jgi:hypothetical protein
MSKQTYYRQCHLVKKTATGQFEQTSYIPEPYCEVGRVVKLRDDNDVWDDGWVVVTAGENRQLDESVPDYRKDIKGHRLATGDTSK